jgi:glutamyl-tRNA reductase
VTDAVDQPLDVPLVALVAHARHVPSAAREAFGDRAAVLAHDPRAILVRTCHRAELYLVSDGAPLPEPSLPQGARRLDGLDAARHLFAVAAGLDSVVVGEDQVLHQLRASLSDRQLADGDGCPVPVGSHAAGAERLHPVLERLFQVALHLGRETRSWREGPPRSLADVALDRILASTGPLPGRRLLVVGAGRMARLTALAAHRRGAHVVVANRSAAAAEALAADVAGEAAPFGPEAPLADVDAVVLAIGGSWPLSAGARAALVAGTQPVVDLSSPPALDPVVRGALGTRFTSVDDLAHAPAGERRTRRRTRVEQAVDAAEASFAAWLRTRERVPAIRALSDHAESRRAEELDRLFRRVDLEPRERELVEQMSHRLIAGLLHDPLVALRDDDSGDAERAARTLFAL